MNTQQTRDFFNRMAPQWDQMSSHNPDKIHTILGMADIPENAEILDIATGTGIMIPFLLDKNPKHITAIDLSDKMIEEARRKCLDPRVSFETADLYQFNCDPVDLALIYSAYPHFPDKKALAEKLYELIKPGGRFMIAHSESKEKINSRHSGEHVRKVSEGLQNVETESAYFENLFDIDTMIDTSEIYILSGIRKQK
ncbi:MAG: class I SAM-dependent DNA methyltransferase [Eubacteriaceae bacterium]|jgi:ubiquinone/menaquinone biosynthesis C-methylase UbiE